MSSPGMRGCCCAVAKPRRAPIPTRGTCMDKSAGSSGLRNVDARFLLPMFPQTAIAMHPAWSEGLQQAGIRIIEPGNGPAPDLVVAPANLRDAALGVGASTVLLDGRPRPGFGVRTDPEIRRYLPIHTRTGA